MVYDLYHNQPAGVGVGGALVCFAQCLWSQFVIVAVFFLHSFF